jgi:hypothetical protein
MLEVLTAVVALVAGFVAGCWIRKDAVNLFERGVALGLAQLPNLVKSQTQIPHQRHDQNQPKRDPQDKK